MPTPSCRRRARRRTTARPRRSAAPSSTTAAAARTPTRRRRTLLTRSRTSWLPWWRSLVGFVCSFFFFLLASPSFLEQLRQLSGTSGDLTRKLLLLLACLRRAAGPPQFIVEGEVAADGQDAPSPLCGSIRRRGSVSAACDRREVHVGTRPKDSSSDDGTVST